MEKERMDMLHKELYIIQLIIGRMQNNSFVLKVCTISLITVLLAFTTVKFVLLFLLFFFWYLDAYYLHKERCYLKLYDWVIVNRNDSDEYLYSLDYKRFEKEVPSIFDIMFEGLLLFFYGCIVLIVLFLAFYNLTNVVSIKL